MEKKMVRKNPYRIAITGPESTGKSALCEQLALHFSEPYVSEYSRSYLAETNGVYDYNDILEISKGQYEKELSALKHANKFLFCDTDFLVSHIWAMVKYGKSHQWVEMMLDRHPYDFTLLCNIDIPWEFDPLRENPLNREYLFKVFYNELSVRNLPFGVVNGTSNKRLTNAIQLLHLNGFAI